MAPQVGGGPLPQSIGTGAAFDSDAVTSDSRTPILFAVGSVRRFSGAAHRRAAAPAITIQRQRLPGTPLLGLFVLASSLWYQFHVLTSRPA